MARLLFFLIVVLALGLGFAWFADRPGSVVLEWQGNQYQTSLMVVLTALVAVVAAVMIVWWIVRTILDSPRIMRRFFRNRRRDQGYFALSQGLIAAGAGDAALARRHARDSQKLLGSEPLVELLDAQTSLLEGRREEAKARFEAMLKEDQTRLVALRGLYLEAERQGEREAALHFAEEAHRQSKALPWAGNAILRQKTLEGDWEGALGVLETNRSAGLVDKEASKRQRAVLLCALAMTEEQSNPVSAARHAREAHKLAPELVPAAVIGARALVRNNDLARAAGILESAWKREAHPEIADSYVHLRIGDSAQDRLKRARKLAAMRRNDPEGNIAIAKAAIDAQEWKAAREAMATVIAGNPSERACLIMADIEEGEFGDKGRMRDWLSRALRAPKDAAWTADGQVSPHWLPVSPLSGRLDAFEWKVPMARLGAPVAEMFEPIETAATPVSVPALEDPDPMAGASQSPPTLGKGVLANPSSIETEGQAAAVAPARDSGADGMDSPLAPSKEVPAVAASYSPVRQEDDGSDTSDIGSEPDRERPGVFPLSRRPDDPGVDDGEAEPEERKKVFGLF